MKSPGATLSPGRAPCRRAGGAAVSPQRWRQRYVVHGSREHEAHRGWQSASSTSIFKHTHGETQKNWEGRGGKGKRRRRRRRRRGGGGCDPRQSYYKTTAASPAVPRRGDGAARAESPRLLSPLSEGREGGEHPTRTTTTHNTTAASPAACRGSKRKVWIENELERLPPPSLLLFLSSAPLPQDPSFPPSSKNEK